MIVGSEHGTPRASTRTAWPTSCSRGWKRAAGASTTARPWCGSTLARAASGSTFSLIDRLDDTLTAMKRQPIEHVKLQNRS